MVDKDARIIAIAALLLALFSVVATEFGWIG